MGSMSGGLLIVDCRCVEARKGNEVRVQVKQGSGWLKLRETLPTLPTFEDGPVSLDVLAIMGGGAIDVLLGV